MLTALGDSSFMLYAIHMPILALAFHRFQPGSVPARLGTLTLFLAGSALLALALARRIEAPLPSRMRAPGERRAAAA